MKKIHCMLLFLITPFIYGQHMNELIGEWSGWYEEGQRNYDIRLNIERYNGIVYEGKIKLIYDSKEAQFSVEADLENSILSINERDMLSQYAPKYIENPQWCKADYEFTFSNLGKVLQLEGIAKIPEVNISYIKGVKKYNSEKCTYFNSGEIVLQRKNPNFKENVEVSLFEQELDTSESLIKSEDPIMEIASENEIIKNEPWFLALIHKIFKKKELKSDILENKTLDQLKEEKIEIVDKKVEETTRENAVDVAVAKENNGREVVEAKIIKATSNEAQIQVWDNRSVDGDIISIYHNGKLVEANIALLKERKQLTIPLERGKNVIVMHAENLGEIPPNSAAMKLKIGSKEYSMVLTSDTKKSESIVIYYYP